MSTLKCTECNKEFKAGFVDVTKTVGMSGIQWSIFKPFKTFAIWPFQTSLVSNCPNCGKNTKLLVIASKTTKIITVSLILAVIVGLGIFIYYGNTKQEVLNISECNTFAESHGCQNNSSTECLNENNKCLVQLGIKNQDMRICDLLSGENKDSCYLGVGVNSKNATICDKIADATYKNPCYREVAISTLNSSLCKKISNTPDEEKDGCYTQVALKTENPSLCLQVDNSTTKDICYGNIANVKGDVSICDNVKNTDWKILCVSATDKNTSKCVDIKNNDIKELCQGIDQALINTSPVGLWEVEKMYSYDATTKQFTETSIDFSVYGGHIYMEFTKDGKWCSQWDVGKPNCNNYDTYTIKGDTMTQHQEGLTGPNGPYVYYEWKVNNGKLELTAEFLDNSTKVLTPMLKYTLKPVSR